MPFPHEIDFYAMLDAEPWLYEFQLELQEEIEALGKELTEAIQELNLLRMPQDCHAEEKALALLLSIGNGRFEPRGGDWNVHGERRGQRDIVARGEAGQLQRGQSRPGRHGCDGQGESAGGPQWIAASR
jgi:hypothetical protein